MRPVKFGVLFLMLLMISGFTSCDSNRVPTLEDVWSAAVQEVENGQCIHYRYHSVWDTRINNSVYRDSADIIYTKIPDSFHGFGFYADNYRSEYIFDGINYREIRHPDQLIVRHDPENIRADSAYFEDQLIFNSTPFELTASLPVDHSADTLLNGKSYYVYSRFSEQTSVADSTKLIRYEKRYYLNPETKSVDRIQKITVSEQDTLQIIDHYFEQLEWSDRPCDVGTRTSAETANYREISDRALEEEQHLQQIAEGGQVSPGTYPSLDGKDLKLYGTPGTKTLIMFSFIGCGGCERAMQDMKERGYRLKPGTNFYYSSPVDPAGTLEPYLAEKGFPFPAFAKESQMNEDFSIYLFPTFVLINSDGVVERLIGGYDETVDELLF